MTIYRATVLDTPEDPFRGGLLRAEQDAGLLVVDGAIVERGPYAGVRARHQDDEVVHLGDGVLLPGFVDTHVHFPQVRIIGELGLPLLDWLDQCALPEEQRLADPPYARQVASEFVAGLVRAGTTSALVFGSHFAPAVDALFAEAARVGVRITAGLVVSDRRLPDPLLTTPERALAEGRALAQRWHGAGHARYAVTPRFTLSCTPALLESCAALLAETPGALFTTHLNENHAEIAAVKELSGAHDYLATYERPGLVGLRSVFAHDVHPSISEAERLGASGACVAHCPSSNLALGSGLFPLARHLEHGVRVALGSDVGAGVGFSLFKEGLLASLVQQVLGAHGVRLDPTRLLWLATRAGADALGLDAVGDNPVGDLGVGRRFDAQWVRPEPGSTLATTLRHATSPEDALAKLFAQAAPGDVRRVWVDGDLVHSADVHGDVVQYS